MNCEHICMEEYYDQFIEYYDLEWDYFLGAEVYGTSDNHFASTIFSDNGIHDVKSGDAEIDHNNCLYSTALKGLEDGFK